MRFIIVGNGFDLHHKIPTSYLDFKKYLIEHHKEEFLMIDSLLLRKVNDDDPWSNVEKTLAKTAPIVPLEYYGDNVIDGNPSQLQFDDANHLLEIHLILKRLFKEWIDSIDVRKYETDSLIHFNDDDLFLNFNFTKTLELMYGVSNERVTHIHADGELYAIGHNVYTEDRFVPYDPSIIAINKDKITSETIDECDDLQLKNACFADIIDAIPSVLNKRTSARIQINKKLFEKIRESEAIINLGFGFNEIDKAYLDWIISKRSGLKIPIITVYYDVDTKDSFEQYYKKNGVSDEDLLFYEWNEVEKALSH